MTFMSEQEIDATQELFMERGTEALRYAALYLRTWKNIVNMHSDGWGYWTPAIKAAGPLMELVQNTRHTGGPAPTMREVIAASKPIEQFIRVHRTRQKLGGSTKVLLPYVVTPGAPGQPDRLNTQTGVG